MNRIRRQGGFGTALRAAVFVFAALSAGCTTLGPSTIPRDRFDYAEAPVFLDIPSAINSYSIETGGNVGVEFQTPLASNANTLGLGAATKYTDRPTITYSPLIGDKFSKSLMTPTRSSCSWSRCWAASRGREAWACA